MRRSPPARPRAPRRFLLVGVGGLARTIADVIDAAGAGEIVALLDDRPDARGTTLFGARVEGPFAELEAHARRLRADAAVIAIGGLRHMLTRAAYFAQLGGAGLEGPALVHPSAVLGQHATVGAGAVVGARVVLGPDVQIGEACVLYSGSVIEHECVLEQNVYVAPGVLFGGRARVGRDSYLGLGAKIADRVTIGAGTVIGAGALVLQDVPAGVVCYGSPARVVRPNDAYRGHA